MAADKTAWTFAATGLAFAAGCLPSARLVARLAHGGPVAGLGDGKPGASNVYRSLGPLPGAAVLALDSFKAYLPAAVLRARGAPDGIVVVVSAAPVVAHVTVVGGQGAAAALGAAFAIDTPATLAAIVPILGGTAIGRHAEGVLLASLTFPVARGRRGRRAAFHAAILPAILITARLRGRRGAGPPRTIRAALNRLLRDRDR